MPRFISDDDMAKIDATTMPFAPKAPGKKVISDDEMMAMENATKPSMLESGTRGLAQGATLGFADEATGGIEALWEKAKGNPEEFGKLYARSRDESRKAYKQAEEANPLTYGGGALGGAVGTAFIPGLNIGAGASLANVVGRSALAGGLAGAGSTEESLLSKEGAIDALQGAGLGAVGGAAGAGLGRLAASGSEKVGNLLARSGDKLDETAERLAARALGAERGTIKKLGEDKVRQAGRYALDEGIVTPLASTDDMIARNAAAQSRAGKSMGDVYKTIDDAGASTFNPLDVASKVEGKVGDFWRSPINRGETNQLENTLESILMRGDKNIPLAEAQTLKQELGKVANWKNSVNITDKEQMARDAYGVVSGAIDDATEQGAKAVGVDGLQETLKQAKQTYGSSKSAESLLENKFAREQGNKLFGLTDTIVGAGGLAGAVPTGGGSLAAGAAALGAKKLGERFGPQTFAVGADKLADVVRQAPQVLGKFAQPLQSAAQRGSQALAATHFVLQQTQPEYQEIMKNLDEAP